MISRSLILTATRRGVFAVYYSTPQQDLSFFAHVLKRHRSMAHSKLVTKEHGGVRCWRLIDFVLATTCPVHLVVLHILIAQTTPQAACREFEKT